MSKDDFKIVVNSSNSFAGTNCNSLDYLFDFSSVGVKGFYKLTFSFVNTGTSLDLVNPLSAEIRINFNSSCNFVVSSTQTSSITTTHIGYLYNRPISVIDGYLSATILDNPPTILQKPTNNQFNVQILKPDGTLFTDNNLASISNYFLILNFEFRVANPGCQG